MIKSQIAEAEEDRYTLPCILQEMSRGRPHWDATSIKGLRRHMALTQGQLAEELGVRQQTVSEWETGAYRPRGASGRLLSIVADHAGYEYGADAFEPQ